MKNFSDRFLMGYLGTLREYIIRFPRFGPEGAKYIIDKQNKQENRLRRYEKLICIPEQAAYDFRREIASRMWAGGRCYVKKYIEDIFRMNNDPGTSKTHASPH